MTPGAVFHLIRAMGGICMATDRPDAGATAVALVDLVFDGLDTVATIELGGAGLGHTALDVQHLLAHQAEAREAVMIDDTAFVGIAG